MTTNDQSQGVVRVRNIDITGFDVRFEEYPSDDGEHGLENIGWIAVKPGTWTLDNKTLVVGTVGSVTESFSSISFSESFSTTPVILSQIQSYNETERGSHTRQKNPSTSGFDVKIEEEGDTSHSFETVGFIAIEPSILRSGGAKVGETKYYPYGVTQEGGEEKYLYTGKEMDKGSGLYYYESRYYNPKTGRFVQPDTILPNVYDPQSLNKYSYVLNNPMRYTDPSGHLAIVTTAIVGMVILPLLSATLFSQVKDVKTMQNPSVSSDLRKDAYVRTQKRAAITATLFLTALVPSSDSVVTVLSWVAKKVLAPSVLNKVSTKLGIDEIIAGDYYPSQQPDTHVQETSTPDGVSTTHFATPYTSYEDLGSYQEMGYGGYYPAAKVQKTVSNNNYKDYGSWQERGYESDSVGPSGTSTNGGGGHVCTGHSSSSISYSDYSYGGILSD